jgi:hypothetical protein
MNRRRPRTNSVALLALALSLSCGATSGEPRVAPDESLTPDEYEQLGFPRLGPDWSEAERTKVRSILRSLAAESPTQLPRFASESSGAVFAKLLHEEFERRGEFEGEVGSLPVGKLEQLDSDALAHLIQSDTLEGIYGPESTGGLLFDRELVELVSQRLANALTLRSDLQANLSHVEASPIPGRDYAARYRESLQSYDLALVQLLSNLTSFAVAERFTPAARSDATSHLAKQIPQIAPFLSPEAQARLREFIHGASASPGADPRLGELSRRL